MPLMQQYNFVNSPVYWATQSQLTYRTQDHLRNEESNDKSNGLDSIQSLRDVNAIKVNDDKNVNYSNSVTVMFNDPKTDNQITLNLTKENFDKLKKHFQDKDFYQRNDGAIRLSGRAEAFVSGWFGDIAYQQNYANADKNNNGHLERAELSYLYLHGMNGHSKDDNSSAVSWFDAYGRVDADVKGFEFGHQYNIEDQLNVFIQMDENFDGVIESMKELYMLEGAIRDTDEAIKAARLIGGVDVTHIKKFARLNGMEELDLQG